MPRRKAVESMRDRVARHIVAQRARLGFTQAILGSLAGLDRSYIGQIERGERNVSADTVDKLAIALGVDVSELLAPR